MTIRYSFLIVVVTALFFGCDRINRDPYADTPTSGIINIGVDENFKNISDAELMVFEGLYRYAKITPKYTTEIQCIQMLLDDSVRLAITYRPLFDNEKASFRERKIIPRELKIATDAIAVIVHPANTDTIISMMELRGILTGEIKQWEQTGQKSAVGNIDVIFDNKNSSILRFVLDSVCSGSSLSDRAYAMDSTVDVVNYVASHRNAIGLIGVSLVSDSDDTTQMSFLKLIKVVALSESDHAITENSHKPYQAYIYQGLYPLSRDVYAINTEPRNGLATGFMSFIASDKGQRIILKSGIVPAVAPIRIVNVRENL